VWNRRRVVYYAILLLLILGELLGEINYIIIIIIIFLEYDNRKQLIELNLVEIGSLISPATQKQIVSAVKNVKE